MSTSRRGRINRSPSVKTEINESLYRSGNYKSPVKFHISEEEIRKDALEELEIEKDIREMFKLYDVDNSGYITKDEIESFVFSIGKPLNQKELKDLFDVIDRDHNGSISVDEFIFYLKTKVYYIPQTEVDEIINCFKVFDVDNDMKITKTELENVFKKFDIKKISQEDMNLFWKLCDKNDDGTVSYAEFVDMWKIR